MTGGAQGIGARAMDRLDRLAAFTDAPGELTRLYLTPAYFAAAAQLSDWMRQAGMAVRMDAVGNIIGRYGEAPGPALVLGSHFDTVRNAGLYDGALGVVAAIAVIEEFRDRGLALDFPIDVVAFGDEEGVRFPTAMVGSRAFAGLIEAQHLEARDDDGVCVREALAAGGLDPARFADAQAGPVAAYLEVHIEQGPVLDRAGLPLGVVSAIAGATRARVEVTGEAGHAGAAPMTMRRDALACAAEMILAVETIAREAGDVVATVGVIDVLPKAANVIAGGAGFSLDIRSGCDRAREAAAVAIKSAFRRICERRDTGFTLDVFHEAPAVACDPGLIAICRAAIEAQGLRAPALTSGPGHDAMIVARRAPVGMIFVRCRDGVSHNPLESIRPGDAECAIRALVAAVLGWRDRRR